MGGRWIYREKIPRATSSDPSTVAVTTPWTPTRTGICESAGLGAVSCFMNSPYMSTCTRNGDSRNVICTSDG